MTEENRTSVLGQSRLCAMQFAHPEHPWVDGDAPGNPERTCPGRPSCPAVCAACGQRQVCPCAPGWPCTGCGNEARCVVCAAIDHGSEEHVRRLPYDEARAVLLGMTPCMAHFACIGRITCQKPGADRD